MKKVVLVLLCCNALLFACDGSRDAASDASSDANEQAAEGLESTKQTASDAMDAAKEVAGQVVASADAEDANQGESVYKTKCVACHATGAAGAPKLDDKAAWEARIAQGNEVLIQHAITGFKGDTGYMPAKGGYMSLSDNDVSLAVQYMVSQAQK